MIRVEKIEHVLLKPVSDVRKSSLETPHQLICISTGLGTVKLSDGKYMIISAGELPA